MKTDIQTVRRSAGFAPVSGYAQAELPLSRKLKARSRDVLRFRTGRELIYIGGFNTGGGTFEQLIDVRNGENDWQTIPYGKFELLLKTGRAVFIEGQWA